MVTKRGKAVNDATPLVAAQLRGTSQRRHELQGRSITKASYLKVFLREPSWPWWLTLCKLYVLPCATGESRGRRDLNVRIRIPPQERHPRQPVFGPNRPPHARGIFDRQDARR